MDWQKELLNQQVFLGLDPLQDAAIKERRETKPQPSKDFLQFLIDAELAYREKDCLDAACYHTVWCTTSFYVCILPVSTLSIHTKQTNR